MKFGSALAIYFIIWWTVLFVVLPLRVKNSAETGATVGDGHDAGAPIAPQLLWKAGVTTVVSLVVFAVVALVMNSTFVAG
jgi:predicted secreted protein